MNKYFDERGQAALMDSLFFLAIVAVVCTGLFFFTVNYGKSMEQQVNAFYSRDFAADSLKVISYVNVMRNGDDIFTADPNPSFGDPGVNAASKEYDYLLALMKEDYSDKKEFSCTTKQAIKSTLSSVLKPFDNSIDYGYYLFRFSEQKYLFLMLAVHKCTGPGCKIKGSDDYVVSREYYFCAPQSRDVLEKYVFPYVGQVDTSIGKVTFKEPDTSTGSQGTPFIMGLSMWVAKDLNVFNDLNQVGDNFNCATVEVCPAFTS